MSDSVTYTFYWLTVLNNEMCERIDSADQTRSRKYGFH